VWPDHRRLIDQQLTALYGGADEAVRRIFFGLDTPTLRRFFDAYERAHGAGPRRYAEGVYRRWKSGAVAMSGEVSERLLKLLPAFLTFEQKYQLVAHLIRNTCPAARLRVDVSAVDGLEACAGALVRAIEGARRLTLPDAVLARLRWLAGQDAVAARTLLAQVLEHESAIIARQAQDELGRLLAAGSAAPETVCRAEHVVHFVGVVVEITVTRRSQTMNQSSDGAGRPAQSRDLVPAQPPDANLPAVPIKDADNLLAEAFRHLDQGKVNDLMTVAAKEALRLQVVQKEGQVDKQILEEQLDVAVQAARRATADPGLQVKVQTEHKGKHGHTSMTIQSAPPQPVVVQAPKSQDNCFVATACFGDDGHPTVLTLRRFRDRTLMPTSPGRKLVAAYYYFGPAMARLVQGVPVLKRPARGGLRVFAWAYSVLCPARA
jgi:hypothetical protein